MDQRLLTRLKNVIVVVCDDSSSSSESSSLTSDSSSESDDDSELGDTKLLLEIRNKLNMKHLESRLEKKIIHPATIIDLPGEEAMEESKLSDIVLKRKRDGLVQEIIISVSIYYYHNNYRLLYLLCVSSLVGKKIKLQVK